MQSIDLFTARFIEPFKRLMFRASQVNIGASECNITTVGNGSAMPGTD